VLTENKHIKNIKTAKLCIESEISSLIHMFVNDTNDMVEFLMFSRYNNSIQRIEFLEQSLRAHQIYRLHS